MSFVFPFRGPFPLLLAPLAGVSDVPFRRICRETGADLTFVEMISATALLYGNQRTLDMLVRHPEETCLGVQVTGRSPDEVGRAVAKLAAMPFDVIDLNMGCPVKKVVKTGCGSAILKDPERVLQTVQAAVQAAGAVPLTVKIRLGWDRRSVNALEVADAVRTGGAALLTVHGRTRADDYSVPVDLDALAAVRHRAGIPVIGNGNLFGPDDVEHMRRATGVDGVMISRGALGNPWIFNLIRGKGGQPSPEEWCALVQRHLRYQAEAYGDRGNGAVCMRKHLLWYASGWPGAKKLREEINRTSGLGEAAGLIDAFTRRLQDAGITARQPAAASPGSRFQWNPRQDMDRKLDRGVGEWVPEQPANGLPV